MTGKRERMSGLRKASVQALLYNAAGQYLVQALTFLAAAVLGRLLDPADFGLVGMILAVNGLLVLLAHAGLAATIVQHRDLEPADIHALWGVAGVLGIAMMSTLALLAPAIAWLFREEALLRIALWVSPSLFFTTLLQVPVGILQRDLRFKHVALGQVAATVLAAGVAIGMAWTGWGYWALVAKLGVRSAGSFVLCSLLAGHSFRLRWDFPLYRRLFGFTGNLTLFQVVNYFHRNLDALLIGRFLGAVSLGFYSRAYTLMLTFNTALGGVITPVLHSAMARRSDQVPALRKVFFLVVNAVLWCSCPLLGFLAGGAPLVIRVVWGPGWSEAARPFFWLALAGMHQPVYAMLGAVFAVRFRTDTLLRVGLITTTLFALSVWMGLPGGIAGVARAYSVMSHLIFLPLIYYVCHSLLEGTFRDCLRMSAGPMLAGWLGVALSRLAWRGWAGGYPGGGAAAIAIALGYGIMLLWILVRVEYPKLRLLIR